MSSPGWALHPFLNDAAPIVCPGISATLAAFVFLFALAFALAFRGLALALRWLLLLVLPLVVFGRRHGEICAAARQRNRHLAVFFFFDLDADSSVFQGHCCAFAPLAP